ncbi:hypothetical protein CLONEX_03512 [[Clostridium] nexile DSM 1787]|nr:hypothetical protein CLONEX_03512 [[Clostridium] nexile DSM 1787]
MNVIFCIPYAGGAASAYGELKMMAEKRKPPADSAGAGRTCITSDRGSL